jgi:MFS family permease
MNRRYLLLGSLYTSQFLPLGFFFIALTAILRRQGASLERIGLLQLLAILWVLKGLWAPLVDRFGWGRLGHYRGWLIVLQSLMVVGVLSLIGVDAPGQPLLLFGLVGVIAFLSATQDVAVDAVAVRLLEPAERGPANGIQIAAGNLGFVLGGGGLLLVFDQFGWVAAVATLAVLTAAPLLPVVYSLTPHVIARSETGGSRVSFENITRFFRQPGVGRWLWAVVPFFYLGIAIPTKLITPMLVDAGWPLGRIGTMASIGGGVIGIAAALGAGLLLKSRRRRTALVTIGTAQLVAIAAAIPLAAGASQPVAGVVAIVFLKASFAATGAAVFTVNMDWSRPQMAGTDYALLSAWAIIFADVVSAAGVSLAGLVGYGWTTALAVSLASVGLVSVARLHALDAVAAPSEVVAPAVL